MNVISVPCPEGYEFDGVRHLDYGDIYLDGDECVMTWFFGASTRKHIALKKIKPETMTLTLKRKEGNTINRGEYYTDGTTSYPTYWNVPPFEFKDNNTKIWRVVSVEGKLDDIS